MSIASLRMLPGRKLLRHSASCDTFVNNSIERNGFRDQQLGALTWMLKTVGIDGVEARRDKHGSC